MEGAVFFSLQSFHVGHETKGWGDTVQGLLTLLLKRTKTVFDVIHQTIQHTAYPLYFPCQNQQQVPIKYDTVYGHGHGICAVYHPAGHWDRDDR